MTPLEIFEIILWIDLVLYGFGGWLYAPTLLKLSFPKRQTAASTLFRGLNVALACGLLLVVILLFRLHMNRDAVPQWLDNGLLYALAAILGVLPAACAFFVWRARRIEDGTIEESDADR